MAGRAHAEPGEVPDLVYSRFNHPNAEILEDQIVPLETGAHAALVFNSGMAAVMTALVPILILYPFLQKYFVRALTEGAVKH